MELDAIPEDLLNKDDLPFTDPEEHHHMSQSKALALNIFKWVKVNEGDPAVEVRPSFLHFKPTEIYIRWYDRTRISTIK